MLDFILVSTRSGRNGTMEVYPKFLMKKSSDMMIRGSDFYAIWLEDENLWSTDEQDVIRLVDNELDKYADDLRKKYPESTIKVLHMWDAESGMIDRWHKYCQKQNRDNYHMLDEKIIFSNETPKKDDYASKKLPYPLAEGDYSNYDKLMSVLYSPEERMKIEWAIGSVITGDSKTIQKFLVLYGAAGTGKSTVLNIIQQLFEGYYAVFDAKALTSSNGTFALEAFRSNPLVAIQHDGDLHGIEDNTRLNSLVSHELMTVNEKFKSTYSNRFKCMLFMGTNKPVKITDARSGIIRRLIDVQPSGNTLPPDQYNEYVGKVKYELGAIAYHCEEVYLENPGRYDDYIPLGMLGATNDFYNFMEESYYIFKKDNETTLKAAWEMYKTYCEEARVPYPYSQRMFKEELRSYFRDFEEINSDGVKNYYSGFRADKFQQSNPKKSPDEKSEKTIIFLSQESQFDKLCVDCPAQYASSEGTPLKKWANVTTKLSDLDTTKLHYVKVPENHIVIDFDFPAEDDKRSLEKNIKEAAKWPSTYAELSKSGKGVHLHYIYDGDVSKLSSVVSEHVEVKIAIGNSSLRRKLSKCNDLPIATISSGLPLKEAKKRVVSEKVVKTERGLRRQIESALRKEIHPDTKSNVDFIKLVLDDAYDNGLHYDVSDMRNAVTAFAMNSTHQANTCLKKVTEMKFKSDEPSENEDARDDTIIFFDCEVFPNKLFVNYKVAGEGKPIVRMIDPSPTDISKLSQHRLIGFNCRKYDNHILMGRMEGDTIEQCYERSQAIINRKEGYIGEAYNFSYTDIYDFSSKKQSLKKFEIELGIHHKELGLPWDQPVPDDMIIKVAEYCDNDVLATEKLFYDKDRQADWTARQILADLAGMTVNDTTNQLTTRIIFGKEKNPELVYTDLSETFPGYEFVQDENGKMHNMYRGEDIGFGGYIRSNPGMYGNVAELDVESMHPHSIIALNLFGEYTENFEGLLKARLAIKHGNYDEAKLYFNGKLSKYLDDPEQAEALGQALKIAINSVYGLTAASFSNPFKDPRNKNNIVALRGALFMKTLKDKVEERGFQIVAIKTDSIKIADATPKIIDFCKEFAKEYGYSFGQDATFERICQVNNADFIAKYATMEQCEALYGKDYIFQDSETLKKNKRNPGGWTVTGEKFAVPYVFKTLFSKEKINFEDKCEIKEVKTALYLDMNEDLPEGEHCYHFVGKVGQFCPIKPGCGGGLLLREGKNPRGEKTYNAATGTKGYRWLESEMVETLEKEQDIDESYYISLVDDARNSLVAYGDVEWFLSDDPYEGPSFEMGKYMNKPCYTATLPWK